MNQKITINGVELDTEEIKNLLNQNKKVEAIKFVCDRTKSRLREAKNLVDSIEAGSVENTTSAESKTKNHYSNSAFVEPKRRKFWVYFVIGILIISILYYFYG